MYSSGAGTVGDNHRINQVSGNNVGNNQLMYFNVQARNLRSKKSFHFSFTKIDCYHLIASNCLQHIRNTWSKQAVSFVIYILRSLSRIRKKRNYASYLLIMRSILNTFRAPSRFIAEIIKINSMIDSLISLGTIVCTIYTSYPVTFSKHCTEISPSIYL